MLELSIVIVTYNSEKFINRCLDSLCNLNDGIAKEIIVVDNNSTDKTIEILEKWQTSIRLIKNNQNSGYAGGNNIGVSKANGKFLFFINPDTVIFLPDTFNKLLAFAKENTWAGIIGPQLIFPDESVQRYFCNYYTVLTIFLRRSKIFKFLDKKLVHPLLQNITPDMILELDWLLGSALLVSKENFIKVGMFDEKYRLYFEDVDLCYRMNKMGLKNVYYSNVRLIHDHQRESAKGFSKKTLWHIKSAIRFFNKHGWSII